MEIVTSWEEKGIAKGLAIGRLAEAELLLRLLHRRCLLYTSPSPRD